MKALKTSSLVFLVVLFIGIAGGFTTTEYGSWHYAPAVCELTTGETWQSSALDELFYDQEQAIQDPNPFMPQTGTDRPAPIIGSPDRPTYLEVKCAEMGGVIDPRGYKTTFSVESTKQVNGNHFDTRIKFDPKSTALFVIAGAIIALVGLEMRKKK